MNFFHTFNQYKKIYKHKITAMKKFFNLLFFILVNPIFSQEIPIKEVKSEVNEVTIFIESAQVTRKKTLTITPGTSVLKFTDLSPFIEAKSIQVRVNGEVMVLSVNHQQNFINKLEKPQELIVLEKSLADIDTKIKLENTYLNIIKEEIGFLQENRAIGGKNQELSVVNLKEASTFYSTKLTNLKLKEIEHLKNLTVLTDKKRELEHQIKLVSSKKEFSTGEILVKINSKNNTLAQFELSYLVSNAGWFPSYDIRAKNINEPIELVYKANVRQDTKVDWNQVKLKLSSSEPNISGVAPELKTYYLNYNLLPPTYGKQITLVKGKVADETGVLPGTTVNVKGTTIGTTTDFDGNYSISVPSNATHLTFSFVGMETQTLPISSEIMNVVMESDSMVLEEVVVIAYGNNRNKTVKESDAKIKLRGTNSIAIPTQTTINQTSVDFEIKTPHSIKSDNKSYVVDIESYLLPANYQYFTVPKVNKNVYLLASVTNWEKYNLLEGEANIFFENAYVGKSILDIRNASDTLQISLGRDKNISINREKIKDYTTKQFIGSKKEDSRAWLTTVKNNKNQLINLLVLDQIPVSTLEEIEVKVGKLSGAKHNLESGELKWEFKLHPLEKKELEYNYIVKYPKNKKLILE